MRYSAGSMGRSRLALAPDKIRPVEESRVPLPAGVRQPFTVYVNGVRQEFGRDYQVSEGELVFSRKLVKEGRLGFWRWFLGAWGIGTYGRNDQVDVAWEEDGRPQVAHALDIAPGAPDSRV
jgi:hypothetical protein